MTVEEIKAEIKRLNEKLEKKKLEEQVQPPISQPLSKRQDWEDWKEYIQSGSCSYGYPDSRYDIGKPSGVTGPYNWVTGEWASEGLTEIDENEYVITNSECVCVKMIYRGSFTVGDMYEIVDEDESSIVLSDNNNEDCIIIKEMFEEYFVRKIIDLNE